MAVLEVLLIKHIAALSQPAMLICMSAVEGLPLMEEKLLISAKVMVGGTQKHLPVPK
jgi:hypothetical protein